jgi:hypothetical protein
MARAQKIPTAFPQLWKRHQHGLFEISQVAAILPYPVGMSASVRLEKSVYHKECCRQDKYYPFESKELTSEDPRRQWLPSALVTGPGRS